ncbi:MAG TPA: YetF domain-containing protein [Vicinamibacteria bacterium]|nr:YetF domain-containing protein [Vicinamibacteria bacterium]
MDELWRVAVRVLFTYVVLMGLVRASGHRTVRQGTVFDFVLALVLGDMMDDLVWGEVPAAKFVAGVGALTFAHTLLSLVEHRWPKAGDFLLGEAIPVLRDGGLMRDGMRQERMNELEIAHALRQAGLEREKWREVRSAHVENDGTVSVVRHEWAREATRADAEALRETL